MNITFRQLKAFVSVARHKSFTKAADELHLTQSSLSGLIKEMENQLDTRLFDRTTRQMHLSEAGERLLPHALRVIHDMQVLGNEIADLKDFHQGKVRIAAPQQLAASAMPELIKQFKQAYPDIQVNLIDCSVEDVINSVQTLEADLGVGPAFAYHTDLSATELFSSPFRLVVRPDHPLASRSDLTWSEMSDGELITLQEPFANYIADHLPLDISTKVFRSDYEVNFLSTALGMVKQGLGMTMALGYAKAWVDEQNLVMVPISEPQISYKFLLYKHRYRSTSPAVMAFEAFLINYSKVWHDSVG
ncbi:LysR family transcriptional regulator [Moraxella sp. FZLJ2107]|uniref:LysR family transcriptional regulator n=1 Tax=unclassified Moraxella TaxID=2685852 RepID=UPI0020C91BA7|nr:MULTISPECIES: LysR family transcriptional regulator [unclassified Moraxella]UTO05593.1 LysR family transcriptional regulator [Moraxella sp. FZLJ2107]UTO22329.1 LysR family transcriptional regulator [Moraxella sp. FZLJ2109]